MAPEGPGMWVGRTWSMGDPLRGERPDQAGRSLDPDGEDGLELGGKHTPKKLEACSTGPAGWAPECDGWFCWLEEIPRRIWRHPGGTESPRSFKAREEAAPPESGTPRK